jgi:hypothetical protein
MKNLTSVPAFAMYYKTVTEYKFFLIYEFCDMMVYDHVNHFFFAFCTASVYETIIRLK